jgi:small subunit ribosomal protein S16
MLKIRLQRVGKKNDPSFRVVLVEHTMRPQGEFIELLGSYNKVQKQRSFNSERILYWISKGAQLSPTMNNLLVDEKIIDTGKVKAWSPKKKLSEAKPAGEAGKPIETPKEEPKIEEAPKAEESPKIEETKAEEPKAPTPTEGEVGVPTENVGIDNPEPKE